MQQRVIFSGQMHKKTTEPRIERLTLTNLLAEGGTSRHQAALGQIIVLACVICTYIRTYACLCGCVCVYLSVSMCIYVYLCVCIFMGMYAYVWVCI